jgi:hypothetical protein
MAPVVGLEPTLSADERPKTYALDRAATGIGRCFQYFSLICLQCVRTREASATPDSAILTDFENVKNK